MGRPRKSQLRKPLTSYISSMMILIRTACVRRCSRIVSLIDFR